MRLPKLIYELYPLLYILIGISTIAIQHTLITFVSGFILALSGTIILLLRRNYRALRQHLEHVESI